MLMGQTSDTITLAHAFIDDFIFWKSPDKTLMLIREAVKLSVASIFGVYFIPIRYLLVAGLWIGTLSNS
jgi:hypothetical protein